MKYLITLLVLGVLIGSVASVDVALAKGKRQHHGGKELIGEKIKQNGKHVIHKVGRYTVSANVLDGKITGVDVVHRSKGPVPVKKYKSDKKMTQLTSRHYVMADNGTVTDATVAQLQYATLWIGYAFYDEYGDEYIYWFPVDIIYDADTGAVWYV